MPTLIKNTRTDGSIWCKHCGEEGRILALYEETVFGNAEVTMIDGPELDNYETCDTADFTITGYTCKGCDAEEDTIDAIATDDWNEVCKSVYGKKEEIE